MKRFFCILLALLFVFCLFSCGENDEQVEEETTLETINDLEEIEYGDGVDYRFMLSSAFENCVLTTEADFEYTIKDEQVQISKYLGSEQKITLPKSIASKEDIVLLANAFEGKSITSLSIPDNVKVCANALCGIEDLMALRIPFNEDLTFLGMAFGATNYIDNAKDVPATLQFLAISNVETLKEYALYDCNDLIMLSLINVKILEKFALCNCLKLKVVYGLDKVIKIGESALMNCKQIFDLEFSNSLLEIGKNAFVGMNSLEELTLPFVGYSKENACPLATLFGAENIDFTNEFYPTKLSKIVLINGCEEIPDYAFYKMENLVTLEMSNSIEKIGIRAFDGCIGISKIAFSTNLQSIGDNAFYGCKRLKTVDLSACSQFESFGVNAFYNCISLTSVKLPSSLKDISASCFAGCVRLSTINLENVQTIGENAFYKCYSLNR